MSNFNFPLRIRGSGNITIGAASAAVDLSSLIPTNGLPARVMLVSTIACYWRSGKTSPTAVTTDGLVPANVPIVVDLPVNHKFVAALQQSAAGTITIYVLDN